MKWADHDLCRFCLGPKAAFDRQCRHCYKRLVFCAWPQREAQLIASAAVLRAVTEAIIASLQESV